MHNILTCIKLISITLILVLFFTLTVNAVEVKDKRGKSPWMSENYHVTRLTPAFPDIHSRYDRFEFRPDSGNFDVLKITGEFPHARYFSFNLYDFFEATDLAAIADIDIKPDKRHRNPFIPGTSRYIKKRSYTIWVAKKSANIPARYRNVITIPEGIKIVSLMTRIYRRDKGSNFLGDVAQPKIEALRTDGSLAVQPEVGINEWIPEPDIRMFFFNEDLIKTWDVIKFFSGNKIVFYRISDANFFPNAHNEYIIAPLAENYKNKVAVITFKSSPTFEDTYQGDDFKGETEVRYWSMCIAGLALSSTPGCLCDDEIIENEDGSVTIIIAPSDLESEIRKSGLNFMEWGGTYKPMLIYRNMLTDDHFPGKLDNIETIGRPPAIEDIDSCRAENWIGEFAPKGRIYSLENFLKYFSRGAFRTAFW